MGDVIEARSERPWHAADVAWVETFAIFRHLQDIVETGSSWSDVAVAARALATVAEALNRSAIAATRDAIEHTGHLTCQMDGAAREQFEQSLLAVERALRRL